MIGSRQQESPRAMHGPASAPASQAGFSSIVNFLFASPEVVVGSEFSNSSSQSSFSAFQISAGQDARVSDGQIADARIADSQIADSLIRSMLSSGRRASAAISSNAGLPVSSGSTSKFVSNSPAAQTTSPDPAVAGIQPAPNALTPSLGKYREPASSTGAALRALLRQTGSKLPFMTVAEPQESKATLAPLAFGMRLTPVVDGSESLSPPLQMNQAASESQMPPQETSLNSASKAGSASSETQFGSQASPTEDSQSEMPRVGSEELKLRQPVNPRSEEAPIIATAAAAGASSNTIDSRTGDSRGDEFGGSAPNSLPLQFAGKAIAAPAPSASAALRTSEPDAAPLGSQAGAPAQQFAVRIGPGQSPAVDIQMVERGGQVHVAVRTADEGLQTSLRQNLGTLVESLERSGFRTESFDPREGLPQLSTGTAMNSQDSRKEPQSGSGGRSNSGDTSQNSAGGEQQQRPRDQHAPKWIEEVENQQRRT